VKPQTLKSWKALTRLASDHVHDGPESAEDGDHLRLQAAGLYVDLSKHQLGPAVLESLLDLARESGLAERIEDLFEGEVVNQSEGRPALHTALRARDSELPDPARVAVAEMKRTLALADAVRGGSWRGYTGRTITDVVHIGIGGSHFGPELTVDALGARSGAGPRVRFVANIDPDAVAGALRGLNPERTLFIVASKSFSTLETRINAETVRSWFLERTTRTDAIASHFVAISTNIEAAREFGISPDNVFAMWDWVGGRYSVWSPVGLPLALAIGSDGFREFLGGAHALDLHFRTTEFAANLPVLMALVAIWNFNFLGITNQAVLPYSERLKLLPDFLQQLTMESNGKSVHQDGSPVGIHTMPVVWGGRGTNGQHAFHQLLHQGTRSFAADFILVADGPGPERHRRWLLANALAQSQAMLLGHEDENPHRQVPGNKGTTSIVMDSLTPATLGALLALYEQVVFCQGVIWNINSFDQWGVELGKQLAIPIHEQLGGKSPVRQDPSTRALIGHLVKSRDTRSTEDE
jgi:glucose-6-phosphate isomerase